MNFFTAILKCICPFWTYLESEMTDFPTFPHTPTSEIRTLPFHLLEACMKKIKLDIPFGQSLLQRPQSLLVIFTDQVLLDPTFCGIFVCGPLQSFVVNVCTLILNANQFSNANFLVRLARTTRVGS